MLVSERAGIDLPCARGNGKGWGWGWAPPMMWLPKGFGKGKGFGRRRGPRSLARMSNGTERFKLETDEMRALARLPTLSWQQFRIEPEMKPGSRMASEQSQSLLLTLPARIWIGGLPEDATWKDLQTLGNTAGATRWVEVFRGKGAVEDSRGCLPPPLVFRQAREPA